MIKRLSKLFETTQKDPINIDAHLLDAHLISIKTCMLEIRNFNKKKVALVPTHIHWRAVDIEAAWPSSKETFIVAFTRLSEISSELGVQPAVLETASSFTESINTFVDQINKIIHHIDTSKKTEQISQTRLRAIDDKILMTQYATNLLHKHVIVDFNYPALPPATSRPVMSFQPPKNV